MKNIVITGGSRGIGRELVDHFLAEGHTVFTLARKIEDLQSINHHNFYVSSCDLRQVANIDKCFQQLPFDKVDILINNAGILIKKVFEENTYEDYLESFQVNYFAPARIIQMLEKRFNPHAHIVNISTMGAVQGSVKFPSLSVYGGTKASLVHLTEILAEEWKDKPLSINCLALGAVQTEMLAEAFPDYQAPLNAQEMAQFIANFALYQGKYFNGKIIPVSSSTP